MKMKNTILITILLIVSLHSYSQNKVGLTYGVVMTMNSPGGEEPEVVWATGVFVGYPFRILGDKHQFIIQPDLSISKSHSILYTEFPEYRNYHMGVNVSFKYSYVTEKKRLSAGFRSGFEGMPGSLGYVLEYDYRLTKKIMLGVNLSSQLHLGAYSEGFTSLKFQLSHRIQ